MSDLESRLAVHSTEHDAATAVGLCPRCNPASDHPDRPSGVDASDIEGGSLVRLWGEIDESLRDQASLAMAYVMTRPGGVVIDTAQVEFLDSSGLAFILQLLRSGAEEGTSVVLRDPPELLLDMLDLVGLGGQVELAFSST